MKKISETIVFFGSGPVAAASLRFISKNFDIEAVITKSVAAHHKESAPVETLAQQLKLPTHFANNHLQLDDLLLKNHFVSAMGILVDYGVIVSKEAISKFDKGIINSHFSLLPQWRGADPITFSILSGQTTTGVSLMTIVPELDEGELISQEKISISPDTTTPELTAKLITLSNTMLIRDIPNYLSGQIKPSIQKTSEVSYSRKLKKSDGLLDWNKTATQLEREIRAYCVWPKCRTTLLDKEVIVTKATAIPADSSTNKSGTVMINQKTGSITVQTAKNTLAIQRLKPSGKNEMSSAEFIRGYFNKP